MIQEDEDKPRPRRASIGDTRTPPSRKMPYPDLTKEKFTGNEQLNEAFKRMKPVQITTKQLKDGSWMLDASSGGSDEIRIVKFVESGLKPSARKKKSQVLVEFTNQGHKFYRQMDIPTRYLVGRSGTDLMLAADDGARMALIEKIADDMEKSRFWLAEAMDESGDKLTIAHADGKADVYVEPKDAGEPFNVSFKLRDGAKAIERAIKMYDKFNIEAKKVSRHGTPHIPGEEEDVFASESLGKFGISDLLGKVATDSPDVSELLRGVAPDRQESTRAAIVRLIRDSGKSADPEDVQRAIRELIKRVKSQPIPYRVKGKHQAMSEALGKLKALGL